MNSNTKLKRKITVPVILVIIISVFILSEACEGYKYRIEACDHCIIDEPETGDFDITFTINNKYDTVPFKIFDGNYESGELLFIDTATTEIVEYTLYTETDYAVAAEYDNDGKKVIVINSGRIKTRRISCQDYDNSAHSIRCWYTIPAKVDVTIKE